MMWHAIKAKIPSLTWIPNYDRKHLRGDVLAGLTTAVMLVPQGMAYAMLAGLPPIHGLYASVVPLALYALLGSSRQLAVGPVAMVSLLVATGVGAIAGGDTSLFVAYAALLALMVGVMQLVMGVGRFGFLVNFLSHPVVSGFTSAAALIIGFSQLGHLLGLDIARSKHVHTILLEAIGQISQIDPMTSAIGLGSILLLVVLKRFKPNFPRALAVVVVGTLLVYLGGMHQAGVAVVGEVPAGLPAPGVPSLDLEAMRALLPIALTISLVAFMESISVARAFATRNRYEVDANQELIGLGVANIGSALFQGYPVTGGFSRTAVNASAGSKTPLASLITAGVVALSLVLLTPLFYYIPRAVLAAIIMVAVFGLVDVAEVKHLWQVKRSDLALLGITFVATLTLGIEEGIGLGVAASMLWFVVRTTRPHFAVLGQLPGTTAYRNVKNHPTAIQHDGVLIIRMDAQFYFGNISFLKERLEGLIAEHSGAPLHTIIIDASAMNQLDSSAAQALSEITAQSQRDALTLLLANVKRPVMDVLRRAHFVEEFGEERFYLTVHDAVVSCSPEPLKDGGSGQTDRELSEAA